MTIRAQDHDEATVHGVIAVLDAWVKLGGRLQYGTSDETSCFLMLDASEHSIWPAAIYPSGKFEIVFQYLKDRPPFDDLALRRELMDRLNAITGVDLPAGKLDLRPGFELGTLAAGERRQLLIETLTWFRDTCMQARGRSVGAA